MPHNWLPLEDWLANALKDHADVSEVSVLPSSNSVLLFMRDGRRLQAYIRNAVDAVPYSPPRRVHKDEAQLETE